MIIRILGSGTSHGIPVVGCSCNVCQSSNRKNKRTRSSILIEEQEKRILIDTATEFRLQAIDAGLKKLDAVLYTHSHADHLHGLDDVRSLSFYREIPVYASFDDSREIRNRFPYIFSETVQRGGGKPRISLIEISGESLNIEKIQIQPLWVKHGVLDILGYKIGNHAAYITDCSHIPTETMDQLDSVKVLILGALRYREHETHFNIDQALDIIKKISPERAYLTHLSHDIDHDQLSNELPGGVFPAYDGLKISIN